MRFKTGISRESNKRLFYTTGQMDNRLGAGISLLYLRQRLVTYKARWHISFLRLSVDLHLTSTFKVRALASALGTEWAWTSLNPNTSRQHQQLTLRKQMNFKSTSTVQNNQRNAKISTPRIAIERGDLNSAAIQEPWEATKWHSNSSLRTYKTMFLTHYLITRSA